VAVQVALTGLTWLSTVLACILKELGLLGMPFRETAMAAAAVKDVLTWALLALVLSSRGRSSPSCLLSPAAVTAAGPRAQHSHRPAMTV